MPVTVSHYLSTGLLTHFHSHGCQYLSNCNSPPRTGILPAISDCCNCVKVSSLPPSPAGFVFRPKPSPGCLVTYPPSAAALGIGWSFLPQKKPHRRDRSAWRGDGWMAGPRGWVGGTEGDAGLGRAGRCCGRLAMAWVRGAFPPKWECCHPAGCHRRRRAAPSPGKSAGGGWGLR